LRPLLRGSLLSVRRARRRGGSGRWHEAPRNPVCGRRRVPHRSRQRPPDPGRSAPRDQGGPRNHEPQARSSRTLGHIPWPRPVRAGGGPPVVRRESKRRGPRDQGLRGFGLREGGETTRSLRGRRDHIRSIRERRDEHPTVRRRKDLVVRGSAHGDGGRLRNDDPPPADLRVGSPGGAARHVVVQRVPRDFAAGSERGGPARRDAGNARHRDEGGFSDLKPTRGRVRPGSGALRSPCDEGPAKTYLATGPCAARMDSRKILLMIFDGLGDRPLNELGHKTPLEATPKPNLDWFASNGVNGLVDPIAPGVVAGSDTSHLALFGYDPKEVYTGRGPFEAAGVGIELEPGDIAFRGNFASADEDLRLTDRRAGRIREGTEELAKALDGLKLGRIKATVREGTEHRVAVMLRGRGLSPKVTDTDPHEIGETILESKSLESGAKVTAKAVNAFTQQSHKILKSHPE